MPKQQTDGLGVPTKITVTSRKVTLSLSGTNTAQIAAALADAGNNTQTPVGSLKYLSYAPAVATVSATGLITAVARGYATVEVSYPANGNAAGAVSGGVMNGTPKNKHYQEIDVLVTK